MYSFHSFHAAVNVSVWNGKTTSRACALLLSVLFSVLLYVLLCAEFCALVCVDLRVRLRGFTHSSARICALVCADLRSRLLYLSPSRTKKPALQSLEMYPRAVASDTFSSSAKCALLAKHSFPCDSKFRTSASSTRSFGCSSPRFQISTGMKMPLRIGRL